jgi:hypothetical protein
MDLAKATALFRHAHDTAWPTTSELETTLTAVTLTVRLGTPVEPVFLLLVADADQPCASVEVNAQDSVDIRRGDYTALPVGEVLNVATLAKLGGALIQASNLVGQLNALAGAGS